MITVAQATDLVLSTAHSFGAENTFFDQCVGRVLLEDLVADRDFPPFDRVTMDGIAINFHSYNSGRTNFLIEGLQAAGSPPASLLSVENCMEVMTGAMLPVNTDTVIRYEDIEIKNGRANLIVEAVDLGQNVHATGADRKKGEVLVPQGCLITPAEVGIAATIGKSSLRTARLPRVVVISTGNELVDISETPLPHQIRMSNVYSISSTLSGFGIKAKLLHINDEEVEIGKELETCLRLFDAIILSGGVSEGKLDFIPGVLNKLGVRKLFHKVAQRPGKPLWFGHVPEGAVVFALPGNPVSTFMCLHRYILPWLRASLGLSVMSGKCAILSEDFHFKPALTYFLQVKLENGTDGKLYAKPISGGGSGDLANLTGADAFLELPAEKLDFFKGEVYPLFQYRNEI